MQQWTGSELQPCLFKLDAVYIMWNARLDETQTWIKIAGRNSNNLSITDGKTHIEESKEGLKSPLDESETGVWKCWLKTQHSKTKIMESGPMFSWQVDGETMETVRDFIFLAPKLLQMVTAAMKLKNTCSLEVKLWQT